MKAVYFTLMILLLSGFFNRSMGQSINLISPPDTVHGTTAETIEAPFDVENTSGSAKRIKVFRVILDEIPGSINYMCWGPTCYTPVVDTTPDYQEIPAGGIDTTFIAYYEAEGNPGITSIKYCFYNIYDEADSTCTIIHFNAMEDPTGGINNMVRDKSIFDIFPNPANNIVTFMFKETSQNNKTNIILHNVIGKIVKEVSIEDPSDLLELAVADLQPGIYFSSLISNGVIMGRKKIIIRR